MRFCPRDPDLPDPVVGAVHPGHSSMKERLELTGVQVPPGPLRSMIVDRKRPAALRAGPRNTVLMDRINVHPLLVKIQIDPNNCPWRLETKYLAIKLGILHESGPPCWMILSQRGPTENSEEPFLLIYLLKALSKSATILSMST